MNESIKLAVPSVVPGGLDADCADHFGHCDLFTLVELVEGSVQGVETIPNDHDGGCGSVVVPLKRAGADAIVVRGIGMRPLMLFKEAGISVLQGGGRSVGDAVKAFQSGAAIPVDERNACGGGPGHEHGHDGGPVHGRHMP